MAARTATPFWRDTRFWRIASQVLFLAALAALLLYFVTNMQHRLARSGMQLGFGFLQNPASFSIGESLIPYDPSMSYVRAFQVGILNTLKAATLGILLTTPLGVLIGVARLSSNWLVARLSLAYVELLRNTPLLIQCVFWYFAVFLRLPPVQEQIVLPGPIFLNVRGIWVPWFGEQPIPTVEGTLITGGATLSLEFAALLVALVLYTSAFIAEIVRAGIQAVPKGQVEAARALGLKPGQVLRLVIFPQALRVIIPPLTSQFLNLTKNSSLALAIAYPDMFAVSTTVFNQTGRTVEVFLIVMAVYLTFSLTTSLLMNLYNRSVRLVER